MIKRESYDALIEEVDATGNYYEVNVNVQHMDENPSKKTGSDMVDEIKIGENIYYLEYTTQIEDKFAESEDGRIKLREGDYVQIDVKNTNQTMHQMIQSSLYGISGGKIGTISGQHTVLIVESTDGKFLRILEDT